MKINLSFLLPRLAVLGFAVATFLINGNNKAWAADLASDLAGLERECQRIGFIPKTEKFGECVLELHKRIPPAIYDGAVQSSLLPLGVQDKFFLECAKMGFKKGSSDFSNCALSLSRHYAEMNLHQKQLQTYQKQADQAERENRLAIAQRLLEIANQGFSFAAGDNTNSAGLRNRRQLLPPPQPSPIQFVSPSGSSYNCSYSGVQLVCR